MFICIHLSLSICMYVNLHYASVYTNLYPICFVLHFIHVYCILYTHVMSQAELLFFTIILKPPDILSCTQSKLTTLFISNNKIKEIRLKVLIPKYM